MIYVDCVFLKWTIADSPDDLVNLNAYELENEQVFDNHSEPMLRDLRHVVQAMAEVLTTYKLVSVRIHQLVGLGVKFDEFENH